MRRVQSFELHEVPACPPFIRESIVESLGRGLRWGRVYDGVGSVFAEFCRRSGAAEVLDLCSGSGDAAAILLESLVRAGRPLPRLALSDLYPNVPAMEKVAARWPGVVQVVREPVDATAVPAGVDRAARTITSAFHHFPPAVATRILADAVASRRAVFILEPSSRSLRFLTMMPILAAAALAGPLYAERDRLRRAVFTYLVPAVPMAGLWGAIVSMLRMYTRVELEAMVDASAATYAWEHAEVPYFPGGRAVAFYGVPRAPARA